MKRGFSIIEVLVVLMILGMVSVICISSFEKANLREALSLEAEKILSALVEARSLTLSAKDGVAWGVHFEERKVVLFAGSSYGAGAPGNQEQPLHNEVKISAVALAGNGAEIRFNKLTGATAQSGIVTLASVRDASQTKIITIAGTGVAHSN